MPERETIQMTRVSFITTVNHNVGDDFVREGIIYLLENHCGRVQTSLIHKHLPITARPEFSWIHDLKVDCFLDKHKPMVARRLTDQIDSVLHLFPWSDRITRCDILVQSGAPIYWANSPLKDCKDNEWWKPLIERRWLKYGANRPFLNLAGGACQPWDSDGSEFADRPATLEYIRRFFDLATLTTLRDTLSVRILKLAGRSAPALPCSSIFSVDRLGIKPLRGEYVALNYMPCGGHYAFGQSINSLGWERSFVHFARKLATRIPCVLVCHDERELHAAKNLLPELELFHSHHYSDYLHCYARAKWGILNRIHGAFALASLGKPATIVGTDTRAQMAGMFGMRSIFVNQADEAWLDAEAVRLESEINSFPIKMTNLKNAAEQKYLELIKSALSNRS
jgi:hypothetical protein